MSLPITPIDEDDRAVTVAARAIVPMLVAASVTALVLVAVRAEPIDAAAEFQPAPPPTPYSDMHARIAPSPADDEPPPPTF